MPVKPHLSVSDVSDGLLRAEKGNINLSNSGRTTLKEHSGSMNDPALLKLGSMSP